MVEITLETVISVGSIITISLVVWNMSRRFTELRKDLDNLKTDHIRDSESTKTKFAETKEERKEEIRSSLENQTNKFDHLWKSIEGLKTDIKEQASRVTQNNTKIQNLENSIVEVKKMIEGVYTFHEKWIQRVEDRIEALRKEFLMMFSAFHAPNRKGDTKE